jgi:hypothetical protein
MPGTGGDGFRCGHEGGLAVVVTRTLVLNLFIVVRWKPASECSAASIPIRLPASTTWQCC